MSNLNESLNFNFENAYDLQMTKNFSNSKISLKT